MEAIGIVAEYNPFHQGHLHHLQETKKRIDLPVIAVMSGSIMQRGEPAFADKWLRSQIAVKNGIDLVIELPTIFSLRSAEYFSKGSVKLLQATGIVKYLSCGAEDSKVDYGALAKHILDLSTQKQLHDYIAQGHSYAKACELVLDKFSDFSSKPNNTLALEYAKALLGTEITQITIPRTGNQYNDLELGFLASATAIRKAYYDNADWEQSVPQATHDLLKANASKIGCDYEKLWNLLNYKLRTTSPENIALITECTEGLERLLATAVNAKTFNEAIKLCTNKRYSSSRIRRLLLQLLIGVPRACYHQEDPAYIRVLGFNEKGRELLNAMKKSAKLPMITKLGKNPFKGQSLSFCQQLELDIIASDITALIRPQQQPFASDFFNSPYYKA